MIEYFGGKDGFNKLKKRDKIKDVYCEECGINLIRMPYYDIKNITSILNKEINYE